MTRRLISPRRWTPPAAPPDAGRTSATRPLGVVRHLHTGGHGPEDVVFDDRGRVLTGLEDGRIVALDAETGDSTTLGSTGGRPLGLEPCSDGTVLICDHSRGLLRLHEDGEVEVLLDTVDGAPLTFASNVAQDHDGTIWLTTSTSRWDLDHYRGDVFEHSGTGRLIRLAQDGTVTTVLTGLDFANGLVLSPDRSHLLIAETSGYRILRHWLAGEQAGDTEPFVDNLPGFPDNMSMGSDGLLWVAIAAPRNPLLDRLLPLPGILRTLVWNLPEAVQPKATPIAWVMAFTLDGRAVHDLRSSTGSYGFVTAVAERNGMLVLGSLQEDTVGVVELTRQ